MIKIIAPKHQHDIISKKLLKNNSVLTNTSLLPLSAFIEQLIGVQNNDYESLLKETLFNLKNELKVLATYVENETFIKSIKDFHIDMYLYNIKPTDLKRLSSKDRDLKLIFDSIFAFIPSEIQSFNKLKETLKKNPLKKVYISKQHLHNNYQQEVYNLIKQHGALDFKEDNFDLDKINLYYANNKRSEVEASAQMIVNDKLNNATIIALNSEYLPLVEQIYSRYNINFNLIKPTANNTFFINFITVIKLIEDPSEISVNQFLSSNPLNLDNITSLIKLNDFLNFNLERLLNYDYKSLNDSIVHKSNLEHYAELAKLSKTPISQLKEVIEIIKSDNKMQVVENLFNYLLSLGENDDLRTLRKLLINNKERLDTNDNLWPILSNILLKNSVSLVDVNSVVVTEALNHYYFNKENIIILGATSNNYPVINRKSGVIDEKYLEDLNYPSKEERYSNQLLQQEEILKGKNIHIFYPLSSYDGKAIEPSFMLIDFAKSKGTKPKRYPLIENDPSEFKTYKLDKDLAQKLFFKDGMLYGSISSFEQYNNCPYAYFLRHGLKLYPKQLPDLSYAYIGSVIHEVMEKIVNDLKDNKKPLENSDLSSLINNLSVSLQALHPTNDRISVVKNLLIRQMADVIKHLKAVEADTSFKPISAEEEFTYTINNNIKLRGYVDRTDQYLDSLRVIDFKSSSQGLSEKQFKQGLQLQLITYLLVMSEKFNLKPAGAFYHTMRLQNTAVIAGKVTKSKDYYYPLLEEDIENQYLMKNRLSGWHFMDPVGFYKTNNFVGGLTLNKAGLSVYGQPKNFETVTAILHQVYEDIYNNLSEGNIDCVPINNPCNYCEYHSICLSKSTNNFKEEIYKNQHLSKEINNEVD